MPSQVYHFPSTWNWPAGSTVDVWAFSDADEVDLLLNGVSQGRQAMPQYGHVEWPKVAYQPGTLQSLAYKKGISAPVATWWVNTTGAPSAVRISIKDGVGQEGIYAG